MSSVSAKQMVEDGFLEAIKGVSHRHDASFLHAVEFGFKQCENGMNLDAALQNARRLLDI